MRAGIAAFSSGVILLYWIGEILPAPVFVLVTVVALAGLRRCDLNRISLALLCLTLGLGWATGMATLRLDARLPDSAEMQQLAVRGFRCSLPVPGAYQSVRFDFCVTEWSQDPTGLAPVRKLKLAVYGDEATLAIPQRLALNVRLKQPHGAYNPAGFRYEAWLFRHGYHATGSVQSWQPDPDITCLLRCRYHQWRERLADSLHGRFGNLPHYPLIESLLLGERRFLNSSDWALFQATGTSHLIAISGLHIGLIGAMAGLAARLLLRLAPPSWLTLPQRRLATVIFALLACALYALMAGFSVPTQRALIMATVAAIVYLRGRLTGHWTAWLSALALVLFIDPFAPLDRGFWLSFVAVACLILAFSGRLRPPGKVASVVYAQFAISAGMLPVLAMMQQAPAVLGWLANILAIPWLSLVVMPLLFLGATSLALGIPGLDGFSGIMDASLGVMVSVLQQVAALTPRAQPLPVALALCLGVLLFTFLFANGRRIRLLLAGVIVALSIGVYRITATIEDNPTVALPELWVWDVGQGLSVLFRDGDETLLYDTGPGSDSGYSAVDSVILPSLRALGVGSLSLLVISHGDTDHASGLGQLLTELPVRRVVSGEPDRLEISPYDPGSALPVQSCERRPPLNIGSASVEFWQAPTAFRKESNNASCVVRIRLPGTEIILPGDSSRAVENLWLEDHDPDPQLSRILLASHHGSQTSSGKDWINALSPQYVVFSSGYQHPYGHPAQTVTARFEQAGSIAFNTAHSGAVRFRMKAGAITAYALRKDAPFWITDY